MKLARLHTWLADHVKWVQYPNVTAADSYTRDASHTIFKNKMSLGKRIDITLVSLLLLLVGTVATGAVLLILYLFISALL